jgi:hypothetical protein
MLSYINWGNMISVPRSVVAMQELLLYAQQSDQLVIMRSFLLDNSRYPMR